MAYSYLVNILLQKIIILLSSVKQKFNHTIDNMCMCMSVVVYKVNAYSTNAVKLNSSIYTGITSGVYDIYKNM